MFPRELLLGEANHVRTRSLFFETAIGDDKPILSLKPQREGMAPSLRDIFIRYVTEDPSEATFAEAVFGDIRHWEALCACKWMQPHLEKWRKIADVKRKAIAFEVILKEVKGGGRSAFTAAKYLIEEPWKDKRKAAVKKEVVETAEEGYRMVQNDSDRIKKALSQFKQQDTIQ